MAKALVCWVFACGLLATAADAQSRVADINGKTVGVLVSEEAWLPKLTTLSRDINHVEGLRLLPMVGAGCVQSTNDMFVLQSVDVALLTADCVDYAVQQDLIRDLKNMAYVARVESLPIVIVTRKEFGSLTALAGKRIATGPAQSAAFASGELLLGGMGLPFARVARSGVDALDALKTGEADAALLLGLDALDGALDPRRFHAIGLTAPPQGNTVYAPALLTGADLKGLTDQDLETVSTALVLATAKDAVNAIKASKVALFSSVYVRNQALLDSAGHLSAVVQGWQRHRSSEKALEALATPAIETNSSLQQGDGP
jgi:hypothetical protein